MTKLETFKHNVRAWKKEGNLPQLTTLATVLADDVREFDPELARLWMRLAGDAAEILEHLRKRTEG